MTSYSWSGEKDKRGGKTKIVSRGVVRSLDLDKMRKGKEKKEPLVDR